MAFGCGWPVLVGWMAGCMRGWRGLGRFGSRIGRDGHGAWSVLRGESGENAEGGEERGEQEF